MKQIKEYNISPPGRFSFNMKELWAYRELFLFFTWRDIKVKYKQTLLGVGWAVLQPLLMMSIFIFFFANKMGLSTESIPAPIFYFSGLLGWNLFSQGITNAGNSMIQNANIIKKIYFPRLIIPLSSTLTAFFDYLMAAILYIGILIYYSIDGLSIPVPQLILSHSLGIIITLLTTFGMGTLLASLNVKYRDFRYIIPFLIQALFFISPIVYSFQSINEPWIRYILALNPISSAIMLLRYPFQELPIDMTLFWISFSAAVLIFFLGLVNFRRTEAYFADLA